MTCVGSLDYSLIVPKWDSQAAHGGDWMGRLMMRISASGEQMEILKIVSGDVIMQNAGLPAGLRVTCVRFFDYS
jgi:hypothetical protein